MTKTTAQRISIDEAKEDKLFYFVVNIVPFRESDGMCLILKRSEIEKVHPGKWAVPGGKLEWSDMDINNPESMNGIVKDYDSAVFNLGARETREECGLEIKDDLSFVSSKVFIRPDGIPVVLIKFAAQIVEDNKDVVLEEGAFTDFAWVDGATIAKYDCIDGVQDEVRKTIALYK